MCKPDTHGLAAEIAQPGKTQAWKACGILPSGVRISLSAPLVYFSFVFSLLFLSID